MKKLILTTILVSLMAAPALANPALPDSPHLGWWLPGADGSTHQYWDFLLGEVTAETVPADFGLYNFIADPTDADNVFALSLELAGGYDSTETLFTADPTTGEIYVHLEIGNYPNLTNYKEIWVDIGFTGELTDISATGVPPGTTIDLGPGGSSGVAEFGFRIYPNPSKEDIFFTIEDGGTLDWIHVDTICIPAPGAILLGSIGVGLVGWLRRRRSL